MVLTVETIEGCVFRSRASPLYNTKEPVPGRARIESVKTITPTPPTHWINERQNCNVKGNAPSSATIVRPVPVHPDIDSKNAERGAI